MIPSFEAYELLHKGALSLAEVEKNGIRIDTGYLKRTRQTMSSKISERWKSLRDTDFYRDWRKEFGNKTNIGSGHQLAHILFNVLEYPNPHKKLKYDEGTLEGIDHPFVKKWMKLQKMEKANGTFLAGIERETVDGFLHPFFNLHTVRTYRSSSDSPNFQNFPVRDPLMAKLIRQCFIPREGHVLVEIDYGGIEVRIAACYNKDPVLIDYIKNPEKDMHRDMAAECFLCSPEQVGKTLRYCGKNMFVFPEFYGSYFRDCALNLWQAIDRMNLEVGDVPAKEWLAKKGIEDIGTCSSDYENEELRSGKISTTGFFEHIRKVEERFWGPDNFEVYSKWKQRWYKKYLQLGCYRTLTGFVIEGNYKRNDVINHPIQGTAFHCLLWSLIEILGEIRKRKMQTKIVGQIHDSIIFDVPVKELQETLELAKSIMVDRLMDHWSWIIVPLEVEAEACPEGGSWYDKKEVKI